MLELNVYKRTTLKRYLKLIQPYGKRLIKSFLPVRLTKVVEGLWAGIDAPAISAPREGGCKAFENCIHYSHYCVVPG